MATVFEYIDESGQDTMGFLFIVGVVVTDTTRGLLIDLLEAIEKQSRKRNRKWHGSDPRYRNAYVEAVSRCKELEGKVFFKKFIGRSDYMNMTAQAAADALKTQRADKAVVYVDGLRESQISTFRRYLKPSIKMSVKIRGVRKDENNALIRLADAVCGLIRDAEDGSRWAEKMVKRLLKRGILQIL